MIQLRLCFLYKKMVKLIGILGDCIKKLQNKNTNQVMQILKSKQHITDHTIQLFESSLQIHSD